MKRTHESSIQNQFHNNMHKYNVNWLWTLSSRHTHAIVFLIVLLHFVAVVFPIDECLCECRLLNLSNECAILSNSAAVSTTFRTDNVAHKTVKSIHFPLMLLPDIYFGWLWNWTFHYYYYIERKKKEVSHFEIHGKNAKIHKTYFSFLLLQFLQYSISQTPLFIPPTRNFVSLPFQYANRYMQTAIKFNGKLFWLFHVWPSNCR